MISTTPRRPIILLPGLPGTEGLLQPFIQACPDDFSPRVLAYPTDEILSYEKLVDYVADDLPDDEPYLLLGESFSGPVALRIAQRRPDGLRGVVMVGSFVAPPVPPILRFLPWRLIFEIASPLYKLRKVLARSGRDAGTLEHIRQEITKVKPAVLASRMIAILTVDAVAALKDCPVPILYIAGDHDPLVREGSVRQIKSTRPDVAVTTVNAPHWILQVAPREAWQAITGIAEDLGLFA